MIKDRARWDAAIVAVRWSARILGLLMAGFLLFMFVGYSIEGSSGLSDSPMGFTLIGIYVGAMFLAIKWERIGSLFGATALGSFFVMMFLGLLPGNVSGGFSSLGILNPVFLALWIPILLYLLCWTVESRGLKAK